MSFDPVPTPWSECVYKKGFSVSLKDGSGKGSDALTQILQCTERDGTNNKA